MFVVLLRGGVSTRLRTCSTLPFGTLALSTNSYDELGSILQERLKAQRCRADCLSCLPFSTPFCSAADLDEWYLSPITSTPPRLGRIPTELEEEHYCFPHAWRDESVYAFSLFWGGGKVLSLASLTWMHQWMSKQFSSNSNAIKNLNK